LAIGNGDRVIVLGGTGYVGRNICDAFTAAGHDVLVIARRPSRVPHECRALAMDLSRTPARTLAKVIADERPVAVVNAAGGVWGVGEMSGINVDVTERLLTALTDSRCDARIVQIGSMMEYAPAPEGTSLDEDAPLGPVDTYGLSKLAASEAVLKATSAEACPQGVVLRISNVAGPGAPHLSLLGRTAEALLTAAEKGEKAVVELQPLRARRDYVDVRDVADATVLAARSDLTGVVLNIGRGEAVAVRALVDLLIEISGVPAEVVELRPVAGGPRTARADLAWLQADTRRAAELLGWRPRRSLEDAVRAVWHDAASRPPHSLAN
jgi:nucleoside-diphosphate-sugar epimerase